MAASSAADLEDEVKRLLDEVEAARAKRNTTADTNVLAASAGSRDDSQFSWEQHRRLLGHIGKVYSLHWSGVESRLVSASQDGKLIDWDGLDESKKHMVDLVNGWVMTCGYDQTQNPRFVASGGLDNACTVFDISGESPIVRTPEAVLTGHDGYLSCCRFIQDPGTIVTSSGDTTCVVWDIRSESQVVRLTDHAGDVMSVSVKPGSGTEFVTGSTDMKAILWDTRADTPAATFVGHEGDINDVDFMSNGLAFATASDDNTVRIFDIRACGCVAVFSAGQPATSVATSRSARVVAAGFEDAYARVWRTLSDSDSPALSLKPTERHDIPDADASHRIASVGFNASGKAFCTGSWDYSLTVWAQKK